MWLKLLAKPNLGEMLKPQLVNGRWRGAAIRGKQRLLLRTYFEKAGVPWIYDKPDEEVDFNSPYNRKPKEDIVERNFEVRLANIRKALSTQDERLEKLRQEKMAAKPFVGHDKLYAACLKALNAENNEMRKSGKQSAAAARAAEQAQAKELGMKVQGKKQGSKSGQTSKGGQIGKKERETINMAKGNMGWGAGDQGAAEVEITPKKEEKQKQKKE